MLQHPFAGSDQRAANISQRQGLWDRVGAQQGPYQTTTKTSLAPATITTPTVRLQVPWWFPTTPARPGCGGQMAAPSISSAPIFLPGRRTTTWTRAAPPNCWSRDFAVTIQPAR